MFYCGSESDSADAWVMANVCVNAVLANIRAAMKCDLSVHLVQDTLDLWCMRGCRHHFHFRSNLQFFWKESWWENFIKIYRNILPWQRDYNTLVRCCGLVRMSWVISSIIVIASDSNVVGLDVIRKAFIGSWGPGEPQKRHMSAKLYQTDESKNNALPYPRIQQPNNQTYQNRSSQYPNRSQNHKRIIKCLLFREFSYCRWTTHKKNQPRNRP